MKRSQQNTDPRYSEAQVTRWLSWLAKNMQRHDQTVFLIEQLRESWLPAKTERRAYWSLVGFLAGAISGPLLAPVYKPYLGIAEGILGYLIFGLITSVGFGLMGFFIEESTKLKKLIRDSPSYKWLDNVTKSYHENQRAILAGLIGGLPLAIIIWLFIDLVLGLVSFSVAGIIGIINWIALQYLKSKASDKAISKNVEKRLTLRIAMVSGVVSGLLFGCIALVTIGLKAKAFLVFGLAGVIMGVWTALVNWILSPYLKAKVTENKVRPNEGIKITVKIIIRSGLLPGLLLGLITGYLIGPGEGIWIGIAIFLVIASLFGGSALLYHLIARFLIYVRGYGPWDYAEFLDYAVDELRFMQRVGGGYIFIHRTLLEHFAAMEEESNWSG